MITPDPDTPAVREPGEIYADTADLLVDAASWLLTRPEWAALTQRLDALERALESDSVVALDRITAEIDLAAPDRVVPIGDRTNEEPPTQAIRERLNVLRHELARRADAKHRPDPPPTVAR